MPNVNNDGILSILKKSTDYKEDTDRVLVRIESRLEDRIIEVKTDLKSDIMQVRTDLLQVKTDLKKDVRESKTDLKMAKRYGWDSWIEINVSQEHY